LSAAQANFDGNYPYGEAEEGPYLDGTCPVGRYRPNGFGLYDMPGQVWEWCADWHGRTYYRRSPRVDPQGPARRESRVVGGGCWYARAPGGRWAFRNRLVGYQGGWRFGFRAVCVLARADEGRRRRGRTRNLPLDTPAAPG